MVSPPSRKKNTETLDSSTKGESEQRTDKARKDEIKMPGEDTPGNVEDEKGIEQVRL